MVIEANPKLEIERNLQFYHCLVLQLPSKLPTIHEIQSRVHQLDAKVNTYYLHCTKYFLDTDPSNFLFRQLD